MADLVERLSNFDITEDSWEICLEAATEIKRLRRLATDRSYMMKAYRDMLGPIGLEVAEMWERKGVTSQHTDWGPDAYALSGEERAKVLLDAFSAVGVPIDDIDAGMTREPAFGPNGETRL